MRRSVKALERPMKVESSLERKDKKASL